MGKAEEVTGRFNHPVLAARRVVREIIDARRPTKAGDHARNEIINVDTTKDLPRQINPLGLALPDTVERGTIGAVYAG
jgi:hypothetical protein